MYVGCSENKQAEGAVVILMDSLEVIYLLRAIKLYYK